MGRPVMAARGDGGQSPTGAPTALSKFCRLGRHDPRREFAFAGTGV